MKNYIQVSKSTKMLHSWCNGNISPEAALVSHVHMGALSPFNVLEVFTCRANSIKHMGKFVKHS